MVFQIETADAFGDAKRAATDGVGVCVAGGIVIVERDDLGISELRAMHRGPLRLFADFACAVRITGRGEAEPPKIVDILLALDDGDRLT
jgi:hypothetical protein